MASVTDRLRSEANLQGLLVGGLVVLLGTKVWLAGRLELYSDEIFYWYASTKPALGYSDLPFMTALLAGLGAVAGGESPLAVRALFLVMGSSIPLLVYWIALPLRGRREALEAALLCLCLPLAAFLGLLAVPDVPLVFLGLLMIGFAERATREDRLHQWLAVGTVAALGFATHYRFVLFPLALLLFLLSSRQHRYLWRTPRLWMAGGIASIGLYPALSFNLQNGLSGLDYHLVDRHPWEFQSEGLMHAGIQAVVVTPLLYAFLWMTLVLLLGRARRGDDRGGLLLLFSATPLLIYLILAPWADTTRTTLHWPLSGYLPLLVFAPAALRTLSGWLRRRLSPPATRFWVAAVPVTGLLGSALALAGIGSQAFTGQLQTWVDADRLSNKMAGWAPMNNHLQQLIPAEAMEEALIVTDNYYTAAQIAFHAPDSPELYTIDRDKAVRDGRLAQFMLWQQHEEALQQQHGRRVLFVTEDSTLNVEEKRQLLERACTLFSGLEYLEQLRLLDGSKTFSFYRGQVPPPDQQRISESCPLPSYAWLDSPAPGTTADRQLPVSGWAFNNGNGIDRVELHIEGRYVTELHRSVDRPDVVDAMSAGRDPAAPQLGFDSTLDTDTLPTGAVTLHIDVISAGGERQSFGHRRVVIRQPGQ